jgi:hypothetical protein
LVSRSASTRHDPFLTDGRFRILGPQSYRMPGAHYVAPTQRALQQNAVRALWHFIAREGGAVAQRSALILASLNGPAA